jgi:hypothetical protein
MNTFVQNLKFPAFDETRFSSWCRAVQKSLMHECRFDLLLSKSPSSVVAEGLLLAEGCHPVEVSTASAWDRLLASRLADAVPVKFHNLFELKEHSLSVIWSVLQARFVLTGPVRQSQLRSEFDSLQFARFATVDDFVARIEELVALLAEVGSVVSPDEYRHKFLSGLPAEYLAVVSQITSTIPPVSFHHAVAMVRDFQFNMRRLAKKIIPGVEKALIANADVDRKRCSRCKQLAHSGACKQKQYGDTAPRPSKDKICFVCGQVGHVIRKCPVFNANREKAKAAWASAAEDTAAVQTTHRATTSTAAVGEAG